MAVKSAIPADAKPCPPDSTTPPSRSKVRLSPWPTSGQALTDAIATLRRLIPHLSEGGVTPLPANEGEATRACELGSMASEVVERYAPNAPFPCKSEAVLRFAAYVASINPGTIRKGGVGPLSVEYVVNHSSAFRNSGAAMILTNWRVRRGGAIG